MSITSFLTDTCRPTLSGFWWRMTAVFRMLWICRASVLPVLVGIALIGWTDQARDIVIADTGSLSNHRALFGILVSVVIWSTVAWYWARVTVQHAFVNPPPFNQAQQAWHGRLTVEVPRLIGTAGMLSVALAFWQAHKLYDYAGDLVRANHFLAMTYVYIIVAWIFYVVVRSRAVVIRWLVAKGVIGPRWQPERTQTTRIFDPQHPFSLWFLLLTLLAGPLFYLLVLLYPVEISHDFFGGAVQAALLGFALMVPAASFLVMLSAQTGLPIFGTAVLAIITAPILFGDFHEVRTLRVARADDGSDLTCQQQDAAWVHQHDRRISLKQAYLNWWDANAAITQPIEATVEAPPMVMVATAGGASRAAFWTAQVLGQIATREEHFTDRLFMISGVSGGSLGAVTLRSIVEADRLSSPDGKGSTKLKDAAEKGGNVIANDFLGPTFAAGLYVDLPSNGISFLPRAWLPYDRAVALEKAWESAWKQSGIAAEASGGATDGKVAWDRGFIATFGGPRPWPVLALNGTSVERGKRIVTSNVLFWKQSAQAQENMSGGINRYDTFDITKADIPISTAVTMSARFPVISPTGALRDCDGIAWTRVTDGGLFENFGALTLEEVLRYLVQRISDAQTGGKSAVPVVILISSDPSLDQLNFREDGYRNAAPPDCQPAGGDGNPETVLHKGNGWLECPANVSESASLLGDPLTALYDGRVARGEAAATALLDRVVDTEIDVHGRLIGELERKRKINAKTELASDATLATRQPSTTTAVNQRLGFADHTDFFHFRQCRVHRRKGPTMSWHDSPEAWALLRDMLGLGENTRDDCGNGAEFFRLCMRLVRLTSGKNDLEASNECATRWPRPENWLCVESDHGWRCGLPLPMKEPRRAQLLKPGLFKPNQSQTDATINNAKATGP